MTEEQKVAYVHAQAMAALIEALGMVAENLQRIQRGESLAYVNDAFQQTITDHGIYHNALMNVFHTW